MFQISDADPRVDPRFYFMQLMKEQPVTTDVVVKVTSVDKWRECHLPVTYVSESTTNAGEELYLISATLKNSDIFDLVMTHDFIVSVDTVPLGSKNFTVTMYRQPLKMSQ